MTDRLVVLSGCGHSGVMITVGRVIPLTGEDVIKAIIVDSHEMPAKRG